MKIFNLEIIDGHAIIKDNGNTILIDTGSPLTIHSSNNLNFLGEVYPCSTGYLGVNINSLSEMLGTNINTLLGVDVLKNYNIKFDYKNNKVTFSNEIGMIFGKWISIEEFMGIPIINMHIDGLELRFFLDTGAKISYLSENITKNYQSLGTAKDFYPSIGEFETQIYEINTKIGNNNFKVKYGNLPPILQMSLIPAKIDGIIGFDFFNNFEVTLKLKDKNLIYSRYIDYEDDNLKLFTKISKKAGENHMCRRLFCTPCGAREIRHEFYKTISNSISENYFMLPYKEQRLMLDKLKDIDFQELIKESIFPDFLGHIGILLQMCYNVEKNKKILTNILIDPFIDLAKGTEFYEYFVDKKNNDIIINLKDLEKIERILNNSNINLKYE